MGNYPRVIKQFKTKRATVPVKDKKEIEAILLYYTRRRDKARTLIKEWQADRDWMLLLLGFNLAFRAEDLLQLKVSDLVGGFVAIKENKTGKPQNFRLNQTLHNDILAYVERNSMVASDYMFTSQMNKNMAITRQQANRVLERVAKGIKLKNRFSMHSMRKTFGYHYYKESGKLLTLMKMYNHRNPSMTLLYICWDTTDAENDRIATYLS